MYIYKLSRYKELGIRLTLTGFSYFVTFKDDFSRYGYVYLMKYKSDLIGVANT